MYLHCIPEIAHDLDILKETKPFSNFKINVSKMVWAVYPKGFSGLVRIIQGQQLSTQAANAMWKKLINHVGSSADITPKALLSITESDKRGMGLSRQKIRYIDTLANNILEGNFCPNRLEGMDDENVTKEIVRQLGLGPWSAQMYLLFCLVRPNILPQGDLGIDRGVQIVFSLDKKPNIEQVSDILSPWDGMWSALSLYLWAIYTDREMWS